MSRPSFLLFADAQTDGQVDQLEATKDTTADQMMATPTPQACEVTCATISYSPTALAT